MSNEGLIQENAIYTEGFSLCSNGSLALGDTALWWKCQSGNFYNLYNSDIAAQCTPALIDLDGATITTATTSTQESSANATVTTAPVTASSTSLISSTGTSSTITRATVSSSSTSTAIAVSIYAGDAMAALAGFAAVALL